MVHKNITQRTQYHKDYYKTHKADYALSKRMQYWRNKLIQLLKISDSAKVTIDCIYKLSENELRDECKKLEIIK